MINPHLEPLDLQGELIILIILLNKILITKICAEIGAQELRLYLDYFPVVVDTSR